MCGDRVLAVVSGKEGVALVRRLGTDVAVDGHHVDVAAALRDFARVLGRSARTRGR